MTAPNKKSWHDQVPFPRHWRAYIVLKLAVLALAVYFVLYFMGFVLMARERLYLFDTTLRDGQQTPGIDFSLDDKLVVMDMLDELGLDYIEGGYPGANPTDTALFAEERHTRATFTAFGMVKRAGPLGRQ